MSTCRNHRERGMSLIEVLAGLILLGVAVATAGDVLSYGLRLCTTANRAASDPHQAQTAAELRRDIQAATATPAEQRRWTSRPLELVTDTGAIVYRRQDDRILRLDRAGGPRAQRQVVTGAVKGWAWRVPSPGLVEVRVVTEVHRDPAAAAANPDPTTGNGLIQETWSFAYARRGGAGGDQW